MYAFVINHFGSDIKYLEYEIYFAINLRNKTKYDIIYMYSINDTPLYFVKIMKKYVNKVISYDDTNITYNTTHIQYRNFNVLRMCNYIFAYKLLEYKKICIIQTDIIIIKNINNIFKNKCPAIVFYTYNKNIDISKNKKIDMTKYNIYTPLKNKFFCNNLIENSPVNSGILLFKPSIELFNKSLENMKYITNYLAVDEILFSYTNRNKLYSLPFVYNTTYSEFLIIEKLNIKNIFKKIYCFHFSGKKYKHNDYIKNNYLNKIKNKNYNIYLFIKYFKNKYYDSNFNHINKLLLKYNS
jgi:hypothetical protein